MSMNFVVTGKARDVFERLDKMEELLRAGDSIVYEGIRNPHNETETYIIRTEYLTEVINGTPARHVKVRELDPAPSRQLRDHSTDFEWGYPGSGPAQLALALIFDATGDRELSLWYHQPFKEAFVQRWGNSWQIRASEIIRWVSLKDHYDKIAE